MSSSRLKTIYVEFSFKFKDNFALPTKKFGKMDWIYKISFS